MAYLNDFTHRWTGTAAHVPRILIEATKAVFVKYVAVQRTQFELGRLNDRELGDIGLDRMMISDCSDIGNKER